MVYVSNTFSAGQQLADSLVRNALSGNRGGGSGGGSGGQGGYAGSGGGGDGILNSLRYGGLFNENTGHSASGDKPRVTVSGAGPGGIVHIHYKSITQ